MGDTKKVTKGVNDELVAGLFELLFGRRWFSRYDVRSERLYVEFRRTAMLLVKELSRTELAGACREDRESIGVLAGEVLAVVEALTAAKAIPAVQAAEARDLLNQILAETKPESVQ